MLVCPFSFRFVLGYMLQIEPPESLWHLTLYIIMLNSCKKNNENMSQIQETPFVLPNLLVVAYPMNENLARQVFFTGSFTLTYLSALLFHFFHRHELYKSGVICLDVVAQLENFKYIFKIWIWSGLRFFFFVRAKPYK